MKWPNYKICVFEFNNNTFIRVATPAEVDKTFEQYMEDAKRISWNGDENDDRGGLKSFTVGQLIHAA